VLLLHRHLDHERVIAGLAIALKAVALTADAVAMEARKLADDVDSGEEGAADIPRTDQTPMVRSLTERRLRAEQLPPDTRPLPTVEKYDQLLPRHRERQP